MSSLSLPSTTSALAVDTSVPLSSEGAAASAIGSLITSSLLAGSSAPVAPSAEANIGAGVSGAVTAAGEVVIAAGPSKVAAAKATMVPDASWKKRPLMGSEERKLLKESGASKQEKLMDAINKATTAYEEKLEEIANANGYKVNRIKELVLYVPPIKSRRKVLDWNIMIYFKGKELNDSKLCYGSLVELWSEHCFSDKGSGDHKTLEEIRDALQGDDDLMAAMGDKDEMERYREEYYDSKEAEAKGKVQRVSGKSMAQVASKTLDLLQAQVCFLLFTYL